MHNLEEWVHLLGGGGNYIVLTHKKLRLFLRFNITVPLVRKERTSQPLTEFV